MAVNYQADGYHTVTPCIRAESADAVIEFCQTVFGAKLVERFTSPDGKVAHAEIRIGDSHIMLGDSTEQWRAAKASFYVYVEDTDATYRRALEAGATSIMEPGDQFYGDRNAGVTDAFGNSWWIATHKEDVTPEELKRRAAARAK